MHSVYSKLVLIGPELIFANIDKAGVLYFSHLFIRFDESKNNNLYIIFIKHFHKRIDIMESLSV